MNNPRQPYFRRKRGDRYNPRPKYPNPAHPVSSETESSYLKSLVDSRSKVTVKMKNGEQIRGRIRYYDRDCFSLGLLNEKKKVFLRKENVCYIAEE